MIRQRLNETARKHGNKLIMFTENYGAGDLLTEKVGFRQIGAIAGIPFGLLYAALPDMDPLPEEFAWVHRFFRPITIGNNMGAELDALLGDKTSYWLEKKDLGYGPWRRIFEHYW